MAAGGIELQFGQTFAARAGAAFGGQAQAVGEGGAHRADIELLPLDCRRGDDVLQQGIQAVPGLGIGPHRTGHAQQSALGLGTGSQQWRQALGPPAKVRPVGLLPDPESVLHGHSRWW
ncbi:hypothetical protein D3C72_1709760 [compost metagenome]